MIYNEKTVPTEEVENIKAIIEIDTSKEISIEELHRIISDLREAIKNNKSILLLSDVERLEENETKRCR